MTTDESLDVKFAIGDKVVHPQHGVGVVAGLEEKQFKPTAARLYYVVSLPDTTLWVPIDLSISGLRKLSLEAELEQCRQVLQDPPQALTTGKDLLATLAARIKQGTLLAQCEVVRDLTSLGWQKPLYGSLSDFQRAILNVLCQEWAAVKGITQAEASYEINELLDKSRGPRSAKQSRLFL